MSNELLNLEKVVLSFWQEKNVFEKSLEKTKNNEEFVFYDGPPFATGLPHHGHLVGSVLKDMMPRYFTMNNMHVKRKFGWDCHGLPVEHELEKQLSKDAKTLVKDLGVFEYNKLCRSVVTKHESDWEYMMQRLGRWVDFKNSYKTMDFNFMESVWFVFKELWNKGLVYKGNKVVPFSTGLNSVLSNFEASSNYQDVSDPSLYFFLDLVDFDFSLLVWTTTPWTLPSNMGVCLNENLTYFKVLDTETNKKFLLSKASYSLFKDKNLTVLDYDFDVSLLKNAAYNPLFNTFEKYKEYGAFKVFFDNYVKDDTGTGCVHLAPAHGEDDNRVMKNNNFNFVPTHVSESGYVENFMNFLNGKKFYEINLDVVKLLKEKKSVFKSTKLLHKYPMCPRTDEPLLYRAVDSWYVAVEKIKDDLLLTNNQINWNPEHLKEGRFGNWLKDARDWAVSRNRVWGNPVPVWVNDKTGNLYCVGSVSELELLTGKKMTDLHKEYVDQLEFSLENEEGTYKRVSEVFDCWFESGCMPYAQNHYPFENKETFEKNFPADFVAEGLDQTRGWFYTLNVLSTALFKKPAFKNVMVNGLVLAKDGKKMSKRLKNYTPPMDLINTFGADALRVYLVSSNLVRAEEQKFDDDGVREVARRMLLPLFNTFKFYETYRELDNWSFSSDYLMSDNLLDLWVLNKLETLKENVDNGYKNYKPNLVVSCLNEFVNDLTNTYVRLNRRRFWQNENLQDKNSAYSTLYTVLNTLSLLMAPLTPFFAEDLYQKVNLLNYNSDKSVHLENFPKSNTYLFDEKLNSAVNLLNDLVLLGRKKRNEFNLKIRMPLSDGTVVFKDTFVLNKLKSLDSYLKNELNLKNINYLDNDNDFVVNELKPNFKKLGKELGSNLKRLQEYLSNLNNMEVLDYEKNNLLEWENYKFKDDDLLLFKTKKELNNLSTDGNVSLLLNLELTQELIEESYSREITSFLQDLRKKCNFNVSDKINLFYFGDNYSVNILDNYLDYISQETLVANSFKVNNYLDYYVFELDDLKLYFKLEKF